jgi:hypothetical protein
MDEFTPAAAPAGTAAPAPPSGHPAPSSEGASSVPASEPQAQPDARAADWRQALEAAPAEELRRHPKFAGIVGSEKQAWQRDWEQRRAAEAQAQARAQAEEELRELARANPVAFADRWLSSEEARAQHERLTQLETNARQQIGKQIGAAFHALPEWADVANDPEALAALADALQGKTDDAILPAWNAAALGLVAERRARALAAQQLSARIAKERAAWEEEAAARGLVQTERPDLVRGGRLASADPEPDFRKDPRAWDAWYRRNTRAGR